MKSKIFKFILFFIALFIIFWFVDGILEGFYIFNFFNSMLGGFFIGGFIALIVFIFCNGALDLSKSEERTKKIIKIRTLSVIGTLIISFIVSFFIFADFVTTMSYEDECFCDERAVYCANQRDYIGYCENHINYLHEDMKNRNTGGSSSGSGGSGSSYSDKDYSSGNYYEDYDYDADGQINQGEWEDALGDYMDDIMY